MTDSFADTSESLEYVFSVAGSSAVQPNDFGTVTVIDGSESEDAQHADRILTMNRNT